MRSTTALSVCLGLLVFGCATADGPDIISHARMDSGAGGTLEAGDDTSKGGGGSGGGSANGGAGSGQGGSLPEGGDVVVEAAPDGPTCDAKAVINEVQTEGSSNPDDEFVELYNGGTCAVVMDDFSLYYRSAAGTTDVTLWTAALGQTLKPGMYFVIGGPGYSTGAPDYQYTGGTLAAAGGGLGLRRGLKMIDMVGWGTATNNYVDGSAATAPAGGASIGRHPDGADTNMNSMDFKSGTPTPRKPNQ